MNELAFQQEIDSELRELALFAGSGGGILGGKLLGWRTVCAVEIEPSAREILMQRQNDKSLDLFPIWDDITTFDGRPWRGRVNVVSGGFPCQEISVAGTYIRGGGGGSMESVAAYGGNSVELSVRFCLNSSSWKTHQCLWEEDLPESSVTLPRWGIMQDGVLSEVPPLAPAWRVKDFGSSLQRPTASDGKRFKEYRLASLVRKNHPNGNLAEQLAQLGMRRLTPECAEILMHWPEGWTDLKPLETDKIRSWLGSHGVS